MPAAATVEPPMTVRGVLPTLLFALSAIIFFGLGNYLAARQVQDAETEQIATLRAELGLLKPQRDAAGSPTTGRTAPKASTKGHERRARPSPGTPRHQQNKMGRFPVSMLRERRVSLVH